MLNKHDKKHKDYLRVSARYNKVCDLIYSLPPLKLAKPYQKGWIIKYDLRPDIKRRKDAEQIMWLLETGYHTYYHTNKVSIVKAVRQCKKSVEKVEGKKKVYVSLVPGRRYLDEKQYEAIPDKLKIYWYPDLFSEVYKRWKRKYYLITLPEYWLVLKARPYMITHTSGKACDLETERQQLYSWMQWYWDTTSSGYSSSYPAGSDRTKIRDNIQKFKKGEIEDIFNEKMGRIYDY